MQAAKDSFFMALCARLQAVNPQRTTVIDGEVRPAIVALENEPAVGAQPAETFCIAWGAATPVIDSPIVASELLSLEAKIFYHTCGSNQGEGDRGRSLTAMDAELVSICAPPQTPKMDYTQNPAAGLGSAVFWTLHKLGAASQGAGAYGRTADLTIYFYPEARA